MFKRPRPNSEAKGNSISRRLLAVFALAIIALGVSACSAPGYDPTTAIGKAGIIDETNLALSSGNCALALQTIQPLYNSGSTDNQVRLLTASAYACFAKISLFPLLANLGSNATALTGSGSGFWSLMAQTFPSVSPSVDRVVEGAALGIDALQSILIPGQVILPANEFNAGTTNPASLLVSDRISDANFYLFFMSLAAIGGLENRYGNPNPSSSYNKQNPLPWSTATAVTSDGCEFASAVVNMIDALGVTVSLLPSNLTSGANNLLTVFNQAVGDSCNYGCNNTVPSGVPQAAIYNSGGGWQASGCTVTTNCSTSTQICPRALRNRSACTAVVTDQVSCAAAGIVNMVNQSVMGWQ